MAVLATKCSTDAHYDTMCDKCIVDKKCARLYHIGTGTAPTTCSDTDRSLFRLMWVHLYDDRAYGLPIDDQSKFCTVGEQTRANALLLYYLWGPSCNDGEIFEIYPGGQSGYCYCGDDCEKSYSNPKTNNLLTALAVILGANILFNAILLYKRAQNQKPQNASTIKSSNFSARTRW